MNLLLLFEADRVAGDRFCIRGTRAEHLRDTLKVEPGKELRAALCDHARGIARVVSVGEAIELDLTLQEPEPKPQVHLLLGMPRPKTLKKVLWEASAWGLASVTLIETKRVEKAFFGATLLRPEQYRPVLHDGMMQGRHVYEPTLSVVRRYRRDLEPFEGTQLIFQPEVEADLAETAVAHPLRIALGPEGGFLDEEVSWFEDRGFVAVHMGGPILRVETAVVSALAQLDMRRRQTSPAT